jgi:CubicO group peptidase (beta-lactamase class C family)
MPLPRRTRTVFLAFLLTLPLLGAALAQDATTPGVQITPISEVTPVLLHPHDAQVGDYLDGLVDGLKKRDRLAGITVAITRSTGDVMLRGFGKAQHDQVNAELDPARTLFRVGSTSKLMTYLSAMQLVEAGQLNLDAPVNALLPEALKIPDQGFSEPIRVRDLMQHTAGFEDLALGHLFVDRPARVLSLQDYLARYRPNRVRAPGVAAVYSNYSVALLGAIIAQVSGQSYEDYVEQRIFQPLKMLHSTFREPLGAGNARSVAPALAKQIAEGFERSGGVFKEQGFEYISQIAPAGGLSTTAADMARFGRMLLNDGELDGARVLQAASLKSMRAGCFRNASSAQSKPDALGVQSICHGFMTRTFGKYQAYGHGGATVFFHTAFLTLPEADLAVFVSINTNNARQSAADIADYLIQFLEPEAQRSLQLRPAVSVAAAESEQIVGSYLTNRRPFSGLTALLQSLNSENISLAASALPKGSIVMSAGGESAALQPIAPLTYQNPETGNIVKFMTNAAGVIDSYAGSAGHTTSSKPHGWMHPKVWIVLTSALTPLCIFTLISAYAGWGSARRPKLGVVKSLSVVLVLAVLAMLAFFAIFASELTGNSALFKFPTLNVQIFAYLATLVAGLSVLKLLCVPSVLKSDWRRLAKVGFVLSALLLTTWTLSSWSWGILHWQVNEIRQ